MILQAIAGVLLAFAGMNATVQDSQARDGADKSVKVDAKALWQELSPEERKQLEENYRRWKRLPAEEQEDMRRRHGALRRLARQVEEALLDEERAEVRSMPQRQRSRELERRTRDVLQRSLNLLPEDARQTLREPRRGQSRAERSAVFQKQLGDQVMNRMRRMVSHLERRGSLDAEDLQALKDRLPGLSSGDRFLVVRDLLLKDPEAFQVTPDMVRRLERARTPVAVLRILPELRAWDLPPEGLRRYLREQEGMPEEDQRGLQRWLRSQGVPGREIRQLFEGEESEWRARLRALRRSKNLPPLPRSFSEPQGPGARRGRGPGPGRSR